MWVGGGAWRGESRGKSPQGPTETPSVVHFGLWILVSEFVVLFGVRDLCFGVQGLGCGVYRVGCRVQDLGWRVMVGHSGERCEGVPHKAPQ